MSKHIPRRGIGRKKGQPFPNLSPNDRREEAQERQKEWGGLSPQEQLKQLDSRYYQGQKGVRAEKQRRKLEAKIKGKGAQQ
jgi:hypothetical protein